MKIAVILTRFLKDYVESYFNSLSLDCELSYYIYNDFAHAGELYLELEKSYDGFLVSGPVPRAAICRRVPVLTKPIVSFGSNALCYYETFFQVQFKEQDFYLERGYFDLLEWLPETVPLHQYLERGQFNQLIYKVYQNTSTYSLEQLCEMEKKIKLKHIRLWNEKKIQYSVTRFSNIIQDLLDAGVNTYFVYPKYEILQESVTLLLQEIHLKTIVQNQNAITALNQQFSDGASVMAPQLSKDPDASAPLTSRSRQLSQKPASPYPMRTAFSQRCPPWTGTASLPRPWQQPCTLPPQRQPPPWQAFRHRYFPGAGTAAVLYKGKAGKDLPVSSRTYFMNGRI